MPARSGAEFMQIPFDTARQSPPARLSAATPRFDAGSASIARLFVDQLGQRAGAHRHHRPAAGHGLEHHEPESLVDAGVYEGIR